MSDEDLFLKASKEFDLGERNEAIWAKAVVLSRGDETEAKYRYIELKVESLKEELEKTDIDALAAHPVWQGKEDTKEKSEVEQILEALEKTRWNRTAAAKMLGMDFWQLRDRIRKYELDDVG